MRVRMRVVKGMRRMVRWNNGMKSFRGKAGEVIIHTQNAVLVAWKRYIESDGVYR